jgi:hypothetical protein
MEEKIIYLDDLKIRDRTEENVLKILKQNPKISTFLMSEHYQWLCPVLGRLKANQKIVEVESKYPWHRFIVCP